MFVQIKHCPPGSEARPLGQMPARNSFLRSKTADKTITDSTTSPGQTRRLLISMIRTHGRGPLGQKLSPTKEKEKKNYFQRSLHTHCLLKYTVWNIVGSQKITLGEHAKLKKRKRVWVDSVVHNSGVCFKSLKILTQHVNIETKIRLPFIL